MPTKQFATQVPSFWNNAELTSLLQAGNVEINAESTETRTSLLAELLLGFGPTLLIVVFAPIARRAASAGGGLGGLGNFGRSQARVTNRSASPSRTWPASMRQRPN